MTDWKERAERAEAELARLRAVEPVAWVDVKDRHEGPYEFHGMALLDSGKHHLYAAPPAQPAEPTIDEQVASVNAVFDAWRNGEDATLTLGLAAQPAEQQAQTVCKRTLVEIDARLRECSIVGASAADAYDTFYQHMVETALAAQPAEPVQRLSDAGIEALAGKHVGNSKLTRVDVISARRLRAKGETFQSIADRFSVDIKTIMAAIKGKQWSHVIDPAAPKATK